MARGDFNKELDRYIANRVERKDWSLFKPKKTREEAVPDDLKVDEVHVIDDSRMGFWERLFRGGKGRELVDEDLSGEEMAKLEQMTEEIDEVEQAEREHPEMIEELEEERETLLQRFFGFFRLSERQHRLDERAEDLSEVEQYAAELDADVTQVLKVMHRWLERLPKRVKDEFKKSRDFEQYRDLLEKYGVARRR